MVSKSNCATSEGKVIGADADGAVLQGEGAIDAGVRARDARQREGHRLDASEVVARAVEIESYFRNREGACAGSAELHESQWIDLPQADVLGKLVLALVEVVISHLHGLDVEEKFFTSQQSFGAIEIVVLNVAQGGIA